MKKKFAILANGWSTGLLARVFEGIKERAKEQNIDLYLYLSYAAYGQRPGFIQGDSNIFKFLDFDDFDGLILMPGTFNSNDAINDVIKRARASKTPSVSLEYDIEGIDSIASENRSGIFELSRHLIEKHNVRDIIYMGGPGDNRDNNTRLKAVEDAFSAEEIIIPKDNILNGQFSHQAAYVALKHWFESHDYMPDAIICANDDMAMGCCTFLKNVNLSVPEDIIVTGYDHLPDGHKFSPILSTVDRCWEEAGISAIDHLLKKIAGAPVEGKQILISKPVYDESCGCVDFLTDPDRIKQIKESSVNSYLKSIMTFFSEQQINSICDAIVEDGDITKISQIVSGMIKGHSTSFGEVCKIYLNDEFIDPNCKITITDGYSDVMTCICDVDENGYKKAYHINRNEIHKDIAKALGGNHFYIFLPLHNNGKSIGVLVFDGVTERIYDYVLSNVQHYVTRTVQILRQAAKLSKANRELEILSVHDALTGVYNRVAYDKFALPVLRGVATSKPIRYIMMVDIDRMKTINDNFGHSAGDVAIKLVADVLKETVPKDSVIIRFGGDEFLIAAACDEKEDMEFYQRLIRDRVKESVEKAELPYSLSVSTGACEFNEDTDEDKVLQIADEKMYSMKEKHHAEADAKK